MLFTIKWLTDIFTPYTNVIEENIPIQVIQTDSRIRSENSLFIPLIGDHFDGHQYLEAAIHNGAVATLWNKDTPLPSSIPQNFPVFLVDDTLLALQYLASKYRDKIDPIVVGITGSNGKTTTKDLVGRILKTTYKTHVTKGNFNNHIGLPLTILSMGNDTEILVLEMGMNDFGEIHRLSKIAEPDYAIVTNIGESHIEFLGSRSGIAKAKLEIVDGMKKNGCLMVDGDESLLQTDKEVQHVLRCGFHYSNDVQITDTTLTDSGTRFVIDKETYQIPLYGEHHAKNAAYAITLAKQLKIKQSKITEALRDLEMTSMRFEKVKGLNGVTIINDAYNASPTSMKASIEVLTQMDSFSKKIVVLGNMFELGDDAEKWHRSVAEVITEEIDVLFTIGDMASYIADEVRLQKKRVHCIHNNTLDDLTRNLQNFLQKDTIILFKASRGMQLETCIAKILPKNMNGRFL